MDTEEKIPHHSLPPPYTALIFSSVDLLKHFHVQILWPALLPTRPTEQEVYVSYTRPAMTPESYPAFPTTSLEPLEQETCSINGK